MARRDYDRLPVEGFGRQLIASGDLDPIYIALFGADIEGPQLKRWLLSYFLLYHAGVASWLSEEEGDQFWKWLLIAAQNELPAPTGQRWPRSSERRHWRGAQAVRSATELQHRYGKQPEGFMDYVTEVDTFPEIAKRVQEHRGFGLWISFKVADMIDRVLGMPVDFTRSQVFMYADPVKGALMVWRRNNNLPEYVKPKDQNEIIDLVVKHLTEEFADLTAPPIHERPVGIQEIETVLCKWKSHVNGHYPLFNDINEINEGLEPWLEHCKTAQAFKYAMPRKEED